MASGVTKEDLISMAKGFAVGAGVYLIPASALNRGISTEILRRAVALGTGAAILRGGRLLRPETATPPASPSKKPGTNATPAATSPIKPISAAVAVVAALTIDSSLSQYTFVNSYLLLRAIRENLPTKIANIDSGPIAVVCIASCLNLSALFTCPDDLADYYRNYILRVMGITSEVHSAFLANPEAGAAAHLYPNKRSPAFVISTLVRSFFRALRSYAPLHFLGFLGLVKKKGGLAAVLESLVRLSRSAAWLSMYSTVGLALLALVSKLKPNFTRSDLMYVMWFAGLALSLERPEAQAEQANYLAAWAADGALRSLQRKAGEGRLISKGSSFSRAAGHVTLLAAFTALAHHWAQQPSGAIPRLLFGY